MTVRLTYNEKQFLDFIESHDDGQVITWQDFAQAVYKATGEYDSYRLSIKTHIARLRKKLGMNLVVSARGTGYYKGEVSICPHCGGAGVISSGNKQAPV